MRRARKPSPALIVAVIALVAAVGGFAVAAVPDRQGRIAACYAKKGGELRVLVKGNRCRRSEKRIRWNQTGPPGAPGAVGEAGPAASVLTASTFNIAMPAGQTRYMHPSGASDLYLEPDLAAMLAPNTAIVAHDLSVRLPNPPGAGQSYTITFALNDGDTLLQCAIEGDVATTCADGTTRIDVPAGSKMAFKVTTSAGATTRRVQLGWRATQP